MKRWKELLAKKFSRKRSRSLIGLDLGTTVIKAVEVSLDREECPVVTAVASRDRLPGEDLNVALAALLADANFTCKEVATAISGKSVIVRHLTTMQMSDEELAQAMRFEADKFLPFDLEEVLVDCERLQREPQPSGDNESQGENTIGVALAACRNTVVDEQYRTVTQAGLTPVAIDAEVFALVNAYEFCNGEAADTSALESEESNGVSEQAAEDLESAKAHTDMAYGASSYEDEYDYEKEDDYDPYTGAGAIEPSQAPPLLGCAVAIADVGATRTQISVLIAGETCFSRDIGVGGSDMTQAIARRLAVDTEEAEQVKRNPGEDEGKVFEALESVIDDLVGELTMSLDFVENHEGISVGKVLLTGGGAGTPGLLAAIVLATECEVAQWDLFENVKVDESTVDRKDLERFGTTLGIAIGLASRVVAA
jgi:Tfp pilus assembly PilM family ATPase